MMSQDLLRSLEALAQRHPAVAIHVFGSSIRGATAPNDLDLLAVYLTRADLDAFRIDLDMLEFSPTVDLVAMTETELLESGFLDRSGATPLSKITTS